MIYEVMENLTCPIYISHESINLINGKIHIELALVPSLV